MCECYGKIKARFTSSFEEGLPEGFEVISVSVDGWGLWVSSTGESRRVPALQATLYFKTPDGRVMSKYANVYPAFCQFCGGRVEKEKDE